MQTHASHIAYLRRLPPAERDRALERTFCDTIEQLSVAIKSFTAARGHVMRNCVVDDLQLARTEFGEKECRVLLRFSASAHYGATGRRDNERLSGNAEASVDDTGAVNYLGITLTEERGFIPHDEGGQG